MILWKSIQLFWAGFITLLVIGALATIAWWIALWTGGMILFLAVSLTAVWYADRPPRPKHHKHIDQPRLEPTPHRLDYRREARHR